MTVWLGMTAVILSAQGPPFQAAPCPTPGILRGAGWAGCVRSQDAGVAGLLSMSRRGLLSSLCGSSGLLRPQKQMLPGLLKTSTWNEHGVTSPASYGLNEALPRLVGRRHRVWTPAHRPLLVLSPPQSQGDSRCQCVGVHALGAVPSLAAVKA